MLSCAAKAVGLGFGAGDGMAAGVTVMVELSPGASTPGAGTAATVYCAAPAPVSALIAQVMFALPLLVTWNVWGGAAPPPQGAANASEVGPTAGPPPTPKPASEREDGGAAQSAPVAVSDRVPDTPLRPTGANVAESGCEPFAASVKLPVATE